MNQIHLPGDPQGRPPYRGRGVLMQGGFLQANANRLQALCDLALNGVQAGSFHFEAVGDLVLFSALYADRMSSLHPQDSRLGSVRENDIGFWVPTLGGRIGQPAQLRWLPAFIFVDSASALMTGREMYGYPKHLGRFIRATASESDFSVTLKAMGFLNQDPTEIGREQEIVRVRRAPDAGNSAIAFPSLGALFDTIRAALVKAGKWEVDTMLTPPFLGMPMVFLRQMRDVTAVDGALVQEIACANVVPDPGVQVGLADDHVLKLMPQASFPIAATLGCQAESSLQSPFWARFDFTVDVGERL